MTIPIWVLVIGIPCIFSAGFAFGAIWCGMFKD